MSLYHKHRPKTLEEMAGNRDTVESLSTVLAGDDPPHAFLLTGPSGTGKTTAARIISSRLGCEELDFREVDSADFRGVDTIRDIRRNSKLKPMAGKVRVWLLDECHQLTKDAQNALLKALEDPPGHAYFLLATTDPEKLLPTIRTRCMEFSFSPLPERLMKRLLTKVAEAEGKELPEEVAQQIALDSLGSARQALMVLEAVISLPKEEMLRAASRQAEKLNQCIELCRTLIKGGSWAAVSGILKGLQREDPEKTRRAVMGYCRAVLLGSATCEPKAALILTTFSGSNLYDSGFDGLVGLCAEVCMD